MSFIHQKNLRKKLKKTFLIILGLYLFIGIGLYFLQESFIFQPSILSKDHTYKLNYEYEEYFHNTEEGALINALHIKAKNPKGVIFYCHGNAGNLQRWGTIVEYFVAMQHDVYIMDYRGFGKSKGAISEAAFYKDVAFSYNHLKQFWDEESIIVYGRSLGNTAATKVAVINNPSQLILETPFFSIIDVAKRRFPIYPIKQMVKYEFPTYKFIKDVKCPISIIHGTTDFTVPYSSAKKLFKVAPKGLTTLITIENGGHNNLRNFEEYQKLIEDILR
jgi:alpha-beta hydrolase superfamily lysophospholipase